MPPSPTAPALDFPSIFRATPNPTILLAPDAPTFTILDANDAYYRATLTTPRDLVGRPLFDAFPDNPADPNATGVANLRASLTTVLATRAPHAMAPQQYDIRTHRPDGPFVTRSWTPINTPVLDPATGDVSLIVHTAEDVTPYLHPAAATPAESALQSELTDLRSAHRLLLAAAADRDRTTRVYDAILSTTDDFAYLFDLRGRFLYANPRLLHVWGRSLPDVIGKTCLELGYEQWHHDMHMREIAQVIDTKRPIRGEVPFTAPLTGHFGVYDYTFSPVFDANGRVEFIAGTTRDVTARKRAETVNAFLVSLDDALRPLADPADLTAAAARLLATHLAADRCTYAEVDPGDQDTVRVLGDHARGGTPSAVGAYRLADFGTTLLADLRADRPSVVDDAHAHEPPLGPASRAAFDALGIRAAVTVPLFKAGRLAATLALHAARPRRWRDDEVALARRVAARCWESLERARAQADLRASETSARTATERFGLAVDAAGLGTFHCPMPLGRIEWNDTCKAHFFLPPDAAVDFDLFYARLHPDDRDRTRAAVERAVYDRAGYDIEYRVVSPDGAAVRWLRAIGRTFLAPDGAPTRFDGITIDVTDRKLAETDRDRLLAALAAERANLAALIEQAPAFICVLRGPDHVFELANDRYHRLINKGPDILGRRAVDVLPEAVGQGFFDILDRVYRTGEPFVGTELPLAFDRGPGAAADTRHLNFVYQPLRDPAGAVTGIFVHGIDVTDSVRARDALAASEARFQAFMANSPAASWITRDDGTVTYVSDSYARTFKVPAGGLLNRPAADFGPPDLVKQWVGNIRKVAESGQTLQTYEDGVRADDSPGRFLVYKFPLPPDPDGNRLVGGVAFDVTDRLAAEDALRASEAAFRQLADAMPQIVWVTRPDGYHEYYNRRWYEYIGLDFERSKGDQWAGPLHPDDQAPARDRWQRSLATGEPYEIEYRFRRHDGVYRWFLARALPVRDPADGHILKWYGTCTDIHDQKLLEAERTALLASERAARADAEAAKATAESANKAKDRFLAVLSHELRTPLTPVALTATSLELDPRVPHDLKADLNLIRRNVDLETRLIDDLLDVSRITAGKLQLHTVPARGHDVVRHALETIAPDVHEKRLTLHTHLDAANDHLTADPARLQQALWNLLKNAIKFTPPGGTINLRTANSPATASDPSCLRASVPPCLAISITDTGKGIPPALLPKIFDPFEQGSPDVTRRFGGLGLGLSIAKAIADLHHGSLAATSDGDNRGATFTLTLPTTPSPTDSPSSPIRHSALDTRQLRILLVEDHPDTARTLARLLKLSNYDVHWSDSVAAAVAHAAEHPFDLLLSDLGLPDASGHDLLRQLRAAHPARTFPAIAMSGYGMEDDLAASRAAGFSEHLIKPVSLPNLLQSIRRTTAPMI